MAARTRRLDRLERLYAQRQRLEREIENAVRSEMPAGTRVYWTHGKHWLVATVTGHAGERVKVQGDSSREYWLYANRVERVIRD